MAELKWIDPSREGNL